MIRREELKSQLDKPERKGFTLIELLVVIAVLTLLIAVILPALNRAKDSAKQLVCAAKMKQWALAELAYTEENNYDVTPYADTMDFPGGGNALNRETYYHYRLAPYLTEEDYGRWGMDGMRKCPMGRGNWGEKAVWIGVYYSYFVIDGGPFIFLNKWDGTTLTEMRKPFKTTEIRTPSNYLMMLDVRRDHVYSPFYRPWDTDYDGDGMNDSRGGIISSLGPYNMAQPKIHRGGCNVSLFDGHVEWISYKEFWEADTQSLPVHQYWYNNRP